MKKYVLGFLFGYYGAPPDVVLIRKTNPEWQRGKLNGVGGKIEDGESPCEAMEREFLEETGVRVDDWTPYCNLIGPDFRVHCFFNYFVERPGETLRSLHYHQAPNGEVIEVVDAEKIGSEDIIPNLNWLIPMALSMGQESAVGFEVRELT